ncbi:hypothetical protein PYW07_014266 [Mythimna separata]|uniref:3'-5' exonuclease domain-containing protein n=1 Tax=Mythimna separata TaxID=271217 RepID=A0AAD7Z1M0_MYTSE|nr:hypothetical protein PYW07_014266 [Mythimna separata]
MMEEDSMEDSTQNQLYIATAVLALGCSVTYIFYKLRKGRRDAADLFNYLTIKTVNTEESCDEVVGELRRRCQKHKALGFDCEWVTDNGKRHPVALVQLSSFDGYCGLFRLSTMKTVPASLKDLLEDETIYKVGVAPAGDGKYLSNDYGVELKTTLDIRHLARLNGFEAGGLAALSSALVGVVLDKSWRIRCSDWEAEEMSQRQINYAAIDAHVAIRMFVMLLEKLEKKDSWWSWLFGTHGPSVWTQLNDYCRKYADVHFKVKHVKVKNGSKEKNGPKTEPVKEDLVPTKRYGAMVRQSPLYYNSYLHAPDGDVLCTCQKKKAMWFVNKGLADVLTEEPLAVRLRFEPAGRPVNILLGKENRCVVCGDSQSYLRKNVVPREYRKNFPELLKERASHDVVLLCAACHERSNALDAAVRARLATHCAAPLHREKTAKKTYEDPVRKRLRSNARALLYMADKLPDARRKELEEFLLQHYPDHDDVTEDLLKEACDIQVVFENDDFETHGVKVVDYYLKNGGLLLLEELWRKHFLSSMEPRFMPARWSVNRNEERLRLRIKEGKLKEEDLKCIGLTSL